MAQVEFYKDNAETPQWRWRVKAANGEIIGAATEGYSREEYAKNNLRALPSYARDLDIRVASENTGDRPDDAILPLEFYVDNAEEWRWRITARNGQIVHASTEGFSSKENAAGNLRALRDVVTAEKP